MIEHELVPKHEILSTEDAEKILEKYNCTREQLPKILQDDPAIKDMNAQLGDILQISRRREVIGSSFYYRMVI